jgi:hypothetical protein
MSGWVIELLPTGQVDLTNDAKCSAYCASTLTSHEGVTRSRELGVTIMDHLREQWRRIQRQKGVADRDASEGRLRYDPHQGRLHPTPEQDAALEAATDEELLAAFPIPDEVWDSPPITDKW